MAGTAGCDAPIRFGTSGWRGVLGEEITFPRLRAALHGIARWLAREGGREVVVAHDTRFLGERMAGLAARILAAHGAGAGVLDSALERLGARVELRRGESDPRFGGLPPDPTRERLRPLARELRGLRGRWLGLATDGDADRFAAVDSDGRVLSETEAAALLVDHLARSGRARRGVAISIATGSLVERIARSHGLPVRRHPIGFKHLSQALVSGEADVAVEESGGFGLAGFAHDKDGILAGCLLAEIMAVTKAPLRARLDELVKRHGPSVCGRIALPAEARAREALTRLRRAPPGRVDAGPVRRVSAEDGLYLALDDGFLMLRLSGTEPLLRVYAEARGPRLLRRRLAAGAALLGLGS